MAIDFRSFVMEVGQELLNLKDRGVNNSTTMSKVMVPTLVLANVNVEIPLPTNPNFDFESDKDYQFDEESNRIHLITRCFYNDCKVKINIPYFDGHLYIENYLD